MIKIVKFYFFLALYYSLHEWCYVFDMFDSTYVFSIGRTRGRLYKNRQVLDDCIGTLCMNTQYQLLLKEKT